VEFVDVSVSIVGVFAAWMAFPFKEWDMPQPSMTTRQVLRIGFGEGGGLWGMSGRRDVLSRRVVGNQWRRRMKKHKENRTRRKNKEHFSSIVKMSIWTGQMRRVYRIAD